jgi:uncharacterized protein (DUF58 family)
LLFQARQSMEPLFDEGFMSRLEYLEIVAKRAFRGSHAGIRHSRRLGAGLEFADHRRYSPGDDFRHIDWNVYARLGKLLLRLYEEEEDLTVYLLVDSSASMGLGDGAKFDQARRLAAALAHISLANLDRVSLVSFGDTITERFLPSRGKAQIFSILRFLSELEANGTTRMEEAFKSFVHQTPRRGLAIVLSDLYNQDDYDASLNVLRFHGFEPIVLHLLDERELNPRLRGDIELIDCETGEQRRLTLTPKVIERFQRAHVQWCDDIETFCRQKQVVYYRASVQTAFDDLVLGLLQAGGLRR